MNTCKASVWRDDGPVRLKIEECGKPAKGERTAGGLPWPVCGIHLRAYRPMIQTVPGRWKAAVPR